MKCSQCGVGGHGRFCAACGTELAPEPQPVVATEPLLVVAPALTDEDWNAQNAPKTPKTPPIGGTATAIGQAKDKHPVGYLMLILGISMVVGVITLIVRHAHDVGPEGRFERAKAVAENVCHFSDQAVEGGINLEIQNPDKAVYFSDIHTTLWDYTGYYIPYVDPAGHHVVKVLIDKMTVSAELKATPHVDSCGDEPGASPSTTTGE
jgi:hypothetical protein